MTHLGDRIAALVDGELDHRARDRALAHVAHCADCRAALDDQRTVKDLLLAA
ncbi:MAG: zf-HC2 domain-containing protein, partial [Actinomycetes bacterium]